MMRGVLLAAGLSSRFGGNKLLHPLESGVSVAEQAAHHLLLAVPASLAVIRPGDAPLRARLERAGLRVVECAAAARGMGASLACAVAASARARGWVVTLADMPWIRPSTIHRVALSVEAGAPIAAPRYRARRGHPVGFAAEWREQLLALNGDAGARDLVTAELARTDLFDVDDAGIVADIDVPADIRARITGFRGSKLGGG
jgi:molybdenum cofactor cytidylyltransferase